MSSEKALFGGGCFWGVDSIFDSLKGVLSTRSGYGGGDPERANYKEICTGTTGHAEVVEIVFDNDLISYETLLDVFWRMHDPTTLNQQGPDRGTQYRSVIFYFDELQKNKAESSRDEYQKELGEKKIVTEMSLNPGFYPAEDYHQDYLKKNPNGYSCHLLPAQFRLLLK